MIGDRFAFGDLNRGLPVMINGITTAAGDFNPFPINLNLTWDFI